MATADKIEILERYFGHSAFRRGQAEIIDAILSGRDALGIMPTGGGKSMCYQVPALMLEGTTLVISPLISLMKDQVMALKNAGVSAAFLNSSLTPEQIQAVYHNAYSGAYKIIYVAPERLESEGFVRFAQRVRISLFAIDEAHCVSQWGQDFRPSYMRIIEFIEKMPQRPVVAAFTATATQRVREDIERILQLRDPLKIVTGFDRPNLSFDVLTPDSKAAMLRSLIDERRERNGIVYCSTRKNVEAVCAGLQEAGLQATRYHAGLSAEERRKNQEDFLYDRCTVMVATNAFGMGIDKSNINYVIHYNMPKSLEEYYQEAGRAGRDGEPAECILLFSPGDVRTAKFLIQSSARNEELTEEECKIVTEQDMKRLKVITDYCKTTDCQRGYILEYFGQEHPAECGNCGSCRTPRTMQDITVQAQMILSCVRRIRSKLGYNVGVTLLVQTMHGSSDKRLLSLGLDKLSTYGLMKDRSRPQIREIIEQLETDGYIYTDPEYGAIRLTDKADSVLFHGKTVLMPKSAQPIEARTTVNNKSTAVVMTTDNKLFERLRALRFRLSQKENVPAYIICSNATLIDMTNKAPETMCDFMKVSGIGSAKAEKYGEIFIKEIIRYINGNAT